MYEFSMNVQLDMNVFDSVVNEWCYEEGDYRLFCIAYKKAKADGTFWEDPAGWDSEYRAKSRAADASWYALQNVCSLVGLAPAAVVAVYKSIRRNAQYQHGWNKEAHFSDNRYFEWEQKKVGSIESFCELCRA